jgi:serine O-acetyltransferase
MPLHSHNATSHDAEDPRPAEALGLLELLAEDFATYGRDLSQPGLWALVSHRIGQRAAVLDGRLARALGSAVHGLLTTGIDWLWAIHLPKSVQVGRRVRLSADGCMFLAARSIGDDVRIRHDTTFGPVRAAESTSLPVIENDADIGSGVCVLGAVTVGRGATIAANSVVVSSVPPRATALGVPARTVSA